jgi:hypothetical protein
MTSNQCLGTTKVGIQCLNKCKGGYCHIHKYNQVLLQGPVYLGEFKDGNKHIYLFGDYHYGGKRCFPESTNVKILKSIDLIGDLINSGKSFDLFTEAEYDSKEFESYINDYVNVAKVRLGPIGFDFNLPKTFKNKLDYYLGNKSDLIGLVSKYKQCFKRNKDKCKYKNVRFHCTDVGHLETRYYGLAMYVIANYGTIEENYLSMVNDEPMNENKILYKILIDLLITEKDNFPIDINKLLGDTKISKQRENIQDAVAADIVDEILKTGGCSVIVSLQTSDIINIINEYNKENYKPLIQFCMDWWYFQIALFDLYMMYRVYRTYRNEEAAKNIIIYAGDLHVQNYVRILKRLDAKIVFETDNQIKNINYKELPFQCVDITRMQLPLFEGK